MKAELIDYMGSDLTIVNSARVSFNKESDWEFNKEVSNYVLSERDKKLIKYLAKYNHFTPFTHATITLRETVPIFVARQRFKHVVGFTYNEVSRRYVDDAPEFYVPDTWRSRPEGSVKQGSGNGELGRTQESLAFDYAAKMEESYQYYNYLLEQNVAPEQARMVLPQSMYTSYYVTGSLAAFARAYTQRIDSSAQVEIQELARSWDNIISELYPESWAALTREENGS